MYTDINFKTFSKKYWYVYLILGAFLVAPPILFLCCFGENRFDAGAWGSLLAGISTYLGAAFLGIVVFYHTWTQQRVNENLNSITVVFRMNADHNGEWYVPYNFSGVNMDKFNHVVSNSDESVNGYVYFSVTNINDRIICNIDFISMYYSFDKIIKEFDKYDLLTDRPFDDPLGYKERLSGFVGGGQRVFDFRYYEKHSRLDYYFVFRVTSLKQDKYFVIVHFYLGKQIDFDYAYINEKEYDNRIKKYGNPVQEKK